MRFKLGFSCACLAALLVLDARAAFALAPQRFSLSWVREPGAETCSTGHRLATLVTHMLGPVLATPDEAEVAIEGSVRLDGDTWRAWIAITDRAGEVLGRRELQSASASCAALDAQVLLVIAIAIDPEVALNGLSPELLDTLAASGDAADDLLAELRAQAAPPAAKPEPKPVAPVRSAALAPARTSEPDVEVEPAPLSLRLGPTLSIGHSPSAVLGVALGLELRPLPRWAVALNGAWLAPSTESVNEPGLQSASARFELQTLSLIGCVAPLLSASWRWHACGGAALTRRRVRTSGLANAPNETRLDASPQVATALAYLAVRPWSITASAALDIPLDRPRFSYRRPRSAASEALFVPAPLGLTVTLALGVEI